MKKTLAIVLMCLMALLTSAALAENEILCEIQEDGYVIRIPVEENDEGWHADETADSAAVKLAGAEKQDGCFVVRYAPAADGAATVQVRHFYCAAACDQALTWDLLVKDGRIVECTGGSHTANPSEDEMDAFISGAWLEKETQFTKLTIVRNEDRGWDVEAVSPMTHGAYVFRATVFYDCAEGAFLYEKGTFFALPAEGEDLGEPTADGTAGSFTMEADGSLVWRDDAGDVPVAFEKQGLSFADLSSLEWSFSSGAGAWSTDMRIAADGTFTGEFHDSEMGDAADAYPDGTVYVCSFSGQMALLAQEDEYTWLVHIDRLTLGDAPEQETIQDGARFVTAEPYGLSEGDTLRLYLPGTPVERLTEDMRFWAHLFEREESLSALEDWFLYSEKNESGFVGSAPYAPEDFVSLANPWVTLTAEELKQAAGLAFRVPDGAENVLYRWLESAHLAEMQFTLDDDSYCARIQPAALEEGEWMNISGMYFAWENEESVNIGPCRGTIGQAQTGSRDWVELCQWYDAAPGLMYSLSVSTVNPDGLDLTAVAEQVYLPLQGND